MTDPREDWDDDRLDLAYRARFDVSLPPELAERISAATRGNRAAARPGWTWLRRRAPAFVAAASIFVAVALLSSSAGWLGPVPRLGPSSDAALPSGIAASDLAGDPFPIQVTTPKAPTALSVLSVASAITSRDRTVGPFEIAVGGWFEFNPAPCPARPDALQPLEDCAINFTWLMAEPESLSTITSDGGGSIHPPVGPGINPVTDWRPPDSSVPTAVVFVGHFHDPGAASCAAENRAECDARFIVDGIAWQGNADLANFPVQVGRHTVIHVFEAIQVRDRGLSTELAVAGWYQEAQPMFCPFVGGPLVFPLEGDCSIDQQWLMANPERLIQSSADCQSGLASGEVCFSERAPSGVAVHPVFESGVSLGGGNPIPPRGSSSPTAVVFLGHFNDPRSSSCKIPALCAQRFVVDAIAWADGTFFTIPSPS